MPASLLGGMDTDPWASWTRISGRGWIRIPVSLLTWNKIGNLIWMQMGNVEADEQSHLQQATTRAHTDTAVTHVHTQTQTHMTAISSSAGNFARIHTYRDSIHKERTAPSSLDRQPLVHLGRMDTDQWAGGNRVRNQRGDTNAHHLGLDDVDRSGRCGSSHSGACPQHRRRRRLDGVHAVGHSC